MTKSRDVIYAKDDGYINIYNSDILNKNLLIKLNVYFGCHPHPVTKHC